MKEQSYVVRFYYETRVICMILEFFLFVFE